MTGAGGHPPRVRAYQKLIGATFMLATIVGACLVLPALVRWAWDLLQ